MRRHVADLVAFLQRHAAHLVFLLPAAVGVTVLHELAHAMAVVLAGGTVLDWGILPRDGAWGHVGYRLPIERAGAMRVIAAAPYLLWLLLAAATAVWT